jgi:hypothetical protein
VRSFLARLMFYALQRVLWGFEVIAVPPCMSDRYFLVRAAQAQYVEQKAIPTVTTPQPTMLPPQGGQYL